MKYFSKNIRHLRKVKGINQGETVDYTGISAATWSDYERGKTEPDFKKLISISEFFQVDISDLLLKDLSLKGADVHLNENSRKKFKKENVHPNVHPNVHLNSKNQDFQGSLVPSVITVNEKGDENIVYVPVKARAGYISGYSDPKFIATLPSYRLPGINNGTYRIFEVDGHSMFNTLHDKDKVICRWATITEIKDDRVYVLVTFTDGLLVKRLINRASEGKIICKSDNNHKGEYPPIVLDIREIKEVWYVTDRWTKQLPTPGEIYKRVVDLEADVILLKEKLLKGD